MRIRRFESERTLELLLILIVIGLCALLYFVDGYKLVVLNLFYLPVVLAAFFLGRYRAGILALFSVIAASVVSVVDLNNFVATATPISIGLTIIIWGAVLGLHALLVGTLSDERVKTLGELHDAYVGVVEVLSRYLHSADQKLKDRSVRIADLSGRVAARMRLSEKEIDDIRVAALLQDMESIEITAKVIQRALGDLESGTQASSCQHTFHGDELAQSLGCVLKGALPLLVDHQSGTTLDSVGHIEPSSGVVAFGARIIQTVRRYDSLLEGKLEDHRTEDVLETLQHDLDVEHHPAVLHALTQVVTDDSVNETQKAGRSSAAETVSASV